MRKALSLLIIISVLLLAINLLACASGRGRVVDINGKPIPNAEVTALQWSEQGFCTQRVFTDSHGRFIYTPKDTKLNSNTYLVLADGYSWGMPGMGLTKDTTITLFREQKLKGKVVDEQGKPISGVKITITRALSYDGLGHHLELNFNTADWSISEAITRLDGSFTLDHLTSPEDMKYGETVISAQMQGRAIVTKTIKQEDLTEELTITLPRECVLAGVLYTPDKAGTAPEGFPLVIRQINGDFHGSREFLVGKDGRFLISQLEPGAYRLVTGPNYMSGTWANNGVIKVIAPEQPNWALPAQDISIDSGEAKVIDLVATQGAIIKGKVLGIDDDQPIKDAVVAAVHSGRPAGTAQTCSVTDENGEFTIRVAAGDVTLSITQVFWGNFNSHTYQPSETPTLSFKIADGEQKTDVVLKVNVMDPSESSNSHDDSSRLAEAVKKKPMIKDLALKTGTYQLKWDPSVDTYHVMSWGTDSRNSAEVQKLMAKTPKLRSEKAKFIAFQFDGEDAKGLLLAILDESHGTGSGFDTVYFDRNRNTDLSDDEPVKLPRQGMFHYTYSKWADVLLYLGKPESRQSYPSSVRLEYYINSGTESIRLQAKGAWHGKIDSNKGLLDCIIPIEFSGYGEYGKHTTRNDIYWSGACDKFYVDTNGFGSAVLAWTGSHRIRLDNPTKISDKYYDIEASKTGESISVKPSAVKLGKFKITSSGISGFKAIPIEVALYNDRGEYTFDLSKGPAVLPIGTYKISSCTLDLINKAGERFKIICVTHGRLTVKSDKTASVDISGNISLELAPRARYITLDAEKTSSINLRAKIGENVTVVVIGKKAFVGNCSMGDYFTSYSYDNYLHPKIDLLGKDGKALISVNAEDSSNNPWLSDAVGIKLPKIEPGIYTMQLTADAKTPLGKLIAKKQAIVRDPAYYKLASEYEKASKAGDLSKAESLKKELLEKYFTWKIVADKPYEISYRNYGEYPTKDKLSGIVTWTVDKDYLRAVVDVTDAYFSTDAYEDKFYRASSLQFYVDPSGTNTDNNKIAVIPKGKNGVPEVRTNLASIAARYTMTPKGYKVDIRIPWKSIKCYNADWKLMPVGVMLNSRTGKDRTQLQLTESTEVYYDPRGFPALVAPLVENSKKSK